MFRFAMLAAMKAEKVYDRPRVLKLGVRAGQRVLTVGLPADGFVDEAREMGAEVEEVAALPGGEAGAGDRGAGGDAGAYDLVFLTLADRAELPLIATARPLIKRDGAL